MNDKTTTTPFPRAPRVTNIERASSDRPIDYRPGERTPTDRPTVALIPDRIEVCVHVCSIKRRSPGKKLIPSDGKRQQKENQREIKIHNTSQPAVHLIISCCLKVDNNNNTIAWSSWAGDISLTWSETLNLFFGLVIRIFFKEIKESILFDLWFPSQPESLSSYNSIKFGISTCKFTSK